MCIRDSLKPNQSVTARMLWTSSACGTRKINKKIFEFKIDRRRPRGRSRMKYKDNFRHIPNSRRENIMEVKQMWKKLIRKLIEDPTPL